MADAGVTERGLERVVLAVAGRIVAEADRLTELDRAIGDGDHGINMRSGMEAVTAGLGEWQGQPLGPALQMIGRQIVMSVGGASGPLFGTWLMTLGRLWSDEGRAGAAFEAALQAVKARGRSERGQKTLIDVVAPVTEAIAADQPLAELTRIARRAAEATRPMRAERGRAAFLGDRSIGHVDPGAETVALMVEAAIAVLAPAEECLA